MRFSAITATLLCALGVFAAPNALPELTELSSNDAIVARAALMDNTPIEERGIHKRDWKCANRKYSLIAIGAAIAKALACIASGEQHGNGCYPHEFRDHGSNKMFPGHSDLWEFPIKDGGSLFGSSKNRESTRSHMPSAAFVSISELTSSA